MSIKQQNGIVGSLVTTEPHRIVTGSYRNSTSGTQVQTIAGTIATGSVTYEIRIASVVDLSNIVTHLITYNHKGALTVDNYALNLARLISIATPVRAVSAAGVITLTAPTGYSVNLAPVTALGAMTVTAGASVAATVNNSIRPGVIVSLNRSGNQYQVLPFTNTVNEIGVVISNPVSERFGASGISRPRTYEIEVLKAGEIWMLNTGTGAVSSAFNIGLAGTIANGVDIQGQLCHAGFTGTAPIAGVYKTTTGLNGLGATLLSTADLGVGAGLPFRVSINP